MAFFPGKKLGGCRNTTYPPKPIFKAPILTKEIGMFALPSLPLSHVASPLGQIAKFTLPNWQVRIDMSYTPKSPNPHCYLSNLFCQIAKYYTSPCELP